MYSFFNTTALRYSVDYTGGEMIMELRVPGIKQEDIDIRYSQEDNAVYVDVGGKEYVHYLQKAINPDEIEAKLDLGILTLTAPIRNTDKKIEIK